MSDPFFAEIRIFAGNFAPNGWAFCNGTLLPIAQNTALFSLIGTIYGGNGQVTFGLPNLQGRTPMHEGNGPGLTPRSLGQTMGTETVSLSESQIPAHRHTATGSENPGVSNAPAGGYVARGAGRGTNSYVSPGTDVGLSKRLKETGGGQPHNNMQPYLAMHFIIALTGIYPSQS